MTTTFFNRSDELEALDERWSSDRGEFLTVYGRRRVGKSLLITHWGQQRRHLYFEATAGSERDHLDDVSRELARVTGRAIFEEQPLTSWRAVFAAFDELLADGPILIAIDEFQFVARRNAEIGSLVNDFVTRHKNDPNLRLVLSGSDVSFFEQDVVGYAATSYGRRTGSLQLQPFAWSEIAPFVPGWSIEDRIRACCGRSPSSACAGRYPGRRRRIRAQKPPNGGILWTLPSRISALTRISPVGKPPS